MDGGSRWGIKGSNELADGLSAIYRFEHKFSTENAGLDGGGRLAHVGLSGGFGTLTLGQIWSASFNATGAITDNSLLWGDSATSYRVGNALSYSNSVGNASLQIDAIMDSSRDTGDAVDQVEFGMTIGLGDIGKLAVGYVESKDTNITTMVHKDAVQAKDATPDTPEMYHIIKTAATPAAGTTPAKPATTAMLERIMVWTRLEGVTTAANDDPDNTFLDKDGKFKGNIDGTEALAQADIDMFASGVRQIGDQYYAFRGTDTASAIMTDCVTGANADKTKCKQITVYVERTKYADGSGADNEQNNARDDDGDEDEGTGAKMVGASYMTDVQLHVANTDIGEKGLGITVGATEDDLMIEGEKLGTPMQAYVPASTTKMDDIKPGYKGTHIAVEFGLGGVTAWLGHSKTENNGGAIVKGTAAAPMNKNAMTGGVVDKTMMTEASDTKVTHAGVRGSVGDGGINYYLAYRSVDAAGAKSNPFLINLNQSLGDGATAFIEHANNDDGVSGKTWVGLKVDF